MTPPSQIAHYKITSKLGEGGMGAVYRATDTRLNRDVAIKVLPEEYSQDADRMARFAREAQVLAGLNHPNIAAIYGLEERSLVLELVPGPDLAERIARGPIPLDEALPIARQLAEALEYAHDRGIIHRDLKPANLKVTPEGKLKVLDFGLAKALASEGVTTSSQMSSPTMTMRATMAGIIMGTAGYMSPEQAKGKPVDRRADIWSFGVVVAEMLTGQMMYTGETVSETLASVIKDQPALDKLPAETPTHIRRLLRRCLEKDPQRRLQAIGEARIALDEVGEEAPPPVVLAPAPPAKRRGVLWLAGGLAAGIALTAAVMVWRAPKAEARPLLRFSADMGPNAVLGTRTSVAISPDGSRIAYLVREPGGLARLATRTLAQAAETILTGTDKPEDPFFSPDGEWIGYAAGSTLWKVSVQGGSPIALCDVDSMRGATWADDGNIYASLDSTHVFRVPSAGGKAEQLTWPEKRGDFVDRMPFALPGGAALMFTVKPASQTGSLTHNDANIEVLSLNTGDVKVVARGGFSGRYVPSGHLLYVTHNTLFGVRFDAGRLEAKGTPVPLLNDVAGDSPGRFGPGNPFAVSRTGTLAYVAGASNEGARPLVWLDATGTRPLYPSPPARLSTPRISPDGKLLAFAMNGDLWVFDPVRGSSTRLTTGASAQYPVWTPNGKQIVFTWGNAGIGWVRSDGSAPPVKLLDSSVSNLVPQSFTPDGRKLAYHQGTKTVNQRDIFVLPLDASDPDHPKTGVPETFLATDAVEADPVFSPDGRWLAYIAGSQGAFHVYVRPYPEGAQGGLVQISTVPGRFPMWSQTRKEIFYVANDGQIQVVPYTINGRTFTAGKPRVWSNTAVQVEGVAYPLDIAPNGKSFAATLAPETNTGEKFHLHVTFLVNFFDELKRKLP